MRQGNNDIKDIVLSILRERETSGMEIKSIIRETVGKDKSDAAVEGIFGRLMTSLTWETCLYEYKKENGRVYFGIAL